MPRRRLLQQALALFAVGAAGCRQTQVAHVLDADDHDMVGSHEAGAETWPPLVHAATAQLLARQEQIIQPVAMSGEFEAQPAGRKRICFVGVENHSAEELGDFRDQIYEQIDTIVNQSESFEVVHRRFVEAGLRQCRLRPDDLFVPESRRQFTAAMEQLEQPVDCLLFAKVTSGTTQNNGDYQRDYLLTLELVDVQSGDFDKESAELRKGYHKSRLSKLRNYGPG